MGIFDFLKKKKNAKTKKIFYDNGSIKEEFQVNADGVKHGSYKIYYPNQQLEVQVNWTNGIQDDGEVISYHDNGEKARQVILLNNKFSGDFFEWYSNGKNKKQGHYLDEKQIILKEWNENGELIENDGNFNTKSSFNESDYQEAIAESKSIGLRLKNSLEKSPNLNRIFGEFTYAIRNSYSVRKYMEEANLLSDFETKNALIEGFTSIRDSFNKMLEKYEDNEVRKDFNALNEAIDILKKEIKNNNNLFEQELENINSQFELLLKSKSDEDYPPIFWYNIVKKRAIHMERGINEKTLSEIQSEWIWMHADEYKNKYSSYSKNDIIDEMTLRIQRFGFIYKTMLKFDKKLNALAKENKISSNSYIDKFKLDMSSAYASLFGTISYALSCGMTNNDISKLYSDFVYDKGTIDGTNPFVNLGTTQEDARNLIKDKLNIDIDNIKTKQVKVKQKASKENNLNKFIEELTQKLEVEKDLAESEMPGLMSLIEEDGANKEVLQSIFETKIPNKDDLKIGKKEKFIELDSPDMGWTQYYNDKLFTGTSIYFHYEDDDEEVLYGWEEETYLEGISHGEKKEFNQDGQLTLLEINKRHPNTKYSSVISSKKYSKKGNLIEDFFIGGQYLQLIKYYENGEKQEIKNYKKKDRVILSIVRLDDDFTIVQHKKWNEKGELIFKKEFE